MNKKTLRALKGSIRKWEEIVAGEEVDDGVDNCPLCQLFYWEDCKGCPVKETTGKECCVGSPYDDEWNDIHQFDLTLSDKGGYVHTEQSLAAAKAELKFLKSLLPKDA